MLPSTGLFKSFACPYYDGGASGTTCLRPYCHYKHVKKDEGEQLDTKLQQAVPEYTPAPKLLALPQMSALPSMKKKKKLEYHPEKPELNASPSKRHAMSDETNAPVYIPAPTTSCNGVSNVGFLNLDDCEEELDEISEIIDDQMLADVNDSGCVEESKSTMEFASDASEDIVKTEVIEQKKTNGVIEIKTIEEKSDKNKDAHKKEERRDSTASSSSSTKQKHRSDTKTASKPKDKIVVSESKPYKENKNKSDRIREHEKEKSRSKEKYNDRRKESDKEKDRSRDSKSSSRHKTSTSTSTHKSSSSSTTNRNSDKHKHKHHSSSSSSTNSSSKLKSSSSTSRKCGDSTDSMQTSRHKSTSVSSTSSKKEQRSKVSTSPTKSSTDFDNETGTLFATTEEDIQKECEMIFDQLEQEFATLHQDDAKNVELKEQAEAAAALKRKTAQDEEDDAAAAASQKKRVAYDNADKFKSQTPAVIRKPNHIRNAMQAIFERQNTLRRKQEEEATAAEAALREAEEKVREANEALRKAKEKNLTPLIPKSYLTPPTRLHSRSIAPVANMLALERAKKKVQELKAEKQPAFTPAQTARGTGRVAHKASVALKAVEPEKKPKPPVLESHATKISFNIRMQYYEMMVKHCTAIYPNIADAWERAQTEELAVFKKCNTPVIYKSSALLAINKLRKEAADSGNKPDSNKIISHEVILAGKLAHNTSWSVQKKMKTDANVSGEPFDKLPSDKAYDMVYELRLTEEQLVANGYPRAGKRIGTAVVANTKPMRRPNEIERYCSRCGKVFSLSMYDEVCVDECNYHPKSTGYRRGFADNQHRCCQQPAGTPGCTYGNYHVSDYIDVDNLTGYVTTMDKPDDYVPTKKDIYALDCEMCYTTHGIELTRVTVVDINARTVYDALVKPDNKIVDYNTIYSGITEQMLMNETRTLRDVQAILMSMFHSKTVLVGHSLDSDLKALKFIHSVVADTSVLFPHKMGPPKKRALKTLCIENLKRIIQENESGHDSAEDAEVCIQLVKFYLRNKIS